MQYNFEKKDWKTFQIYLKNKTQYKYHSKTISLRWFFKKEFFTFSTPVKKGVLKNFSKFTGKHMCQGLFFNKVAGLRTATL